VLTGLLSFMVEESPTTGAIQSSKAEKLAFAKQSMTWNQAQEEFCALFPDMLPQVQAAPPTPACWICMEGEGRSRSAKLLCTGCGCCGGAGLGHLACLAKYACTRNDDATGGWRWSHCPTCKQVYTGEAKLGLARAHWELVRARPVEDQEWLQAGRQLAGALRDEGDFEAALPLYEQGLAVQRRTSGDEDNKTLATMNNLALLHRAMGNPALALPLATEVLAATRRTQGNDHIATLTSINNLGGLHTQLGGCEIALPLYEEALASGRRTLGDAHVHTLTFIRSLGRLRGLMGEPAVGAALLREAVAGFRRVLGEDHPRTRETVEYLQELEDAEGEEKEEEERTESLSKRRRRA
jgi:tetratricopeptide (TPR) repeat protein